MKYYAIREKSTGFFLPQKIKGSCRGYTFEVPKAKCVPRLFMSRLGACAALRAWVQGEWYRKFSTSWEGETDEGIEVKPVLNRRVEDMEVIEINLIIGNPS